ncbi:hypothetical protein C8R43DRAFT_974515, partial [Mycena crocata]
MDSSLAFIVAQTRANVEFLISQHQISAPDGREILQKLPKSDQDRAMAALEQQTQSLLITPPPSTGPPSPVRAKALWGYNEEGQQNSNDLSFRAGDTIEIVAETNADWWTGRYNGRQGLFPSNYVEKLSPTPAPYQPRDTYRDAPPGGSSPAFPMQAAYGGGGGGGGYSGPPESGYPGYPPPSTGGYQPAYGPPGGPPPQQYGNYGGPPPGGPPPPHQYGSYGPPPPGASYGPPPAAQAPPPAAAPAPVPEKPSKMSGLGNTLAHSAVGGVGFGAGSAVGSGIINSIF